MLETPMNSDSSLPAMAAEPNVPTNEEPAQGSRSRWRGKKKVVGFSLFLLGITLLAALFGPLRWGAAGVQNIHAAPSRMLADPISATGYLFAPVYDTNFSSSVTGKISAIYVQLGQQVVAGQIMAHLGYNTYAAQLNAAEVAVDAAHNELNAAEAHVANEFAYINATVALAQTTLQANLNNRAALLQQAQANINFALVTLAADQRTLNSVIAAANASIKSAAQTEASAIAACNATPTPTTSSSSSSSSSDNSGSSSYSSNNNDDNGNQSSTSSCIKAAQDAYKAAVTMANQSVVTAQGTVNEDIAALAQARANANVSLTAINGTVAENRISISVAQLNPDRTNAIIALTSAEYTYRTALAALLIAQQNLALTDLVAPHPGIVTAVIGSISGVPGAVDNLVPAGGLEIQSDHGGLTFIQITDTAHVNRVWTYVDETDIYKVHVGQSASFTLKAYPGHQFTGSVIQIAPNGLGYPGMPSSVKYVVVVAIDGSSVGSEQLYHHMTANVTFQ